MRRGLRLELEEDAGIAESSRRLDGGGPSRQFPNLGDRVVKEQVDMTGRGEGPC